MGIFKRIKDVLRSSGENDSYEDQVDLFSLQPGDIVNIEGDDYEVEGAMFMNDEGWKWVEYKLKEGRSTYWMSVERDDELEIILCREVITGIKEAPGEIEYEGIKYLLDEGSDAVVEKVAGNISVPAGKWVEYWDYFDEEEENAFFIEKWDSEIETSAGRYIEDYNIEIFPISNR